MFNMNLLIFSDVFAVGGLDIDEQYPGKWARMSIWDFAMSADQIKVLTCEDEGNLVNSSSLQTAGGVDHYEEITIATPVESVGMLQ